MPTLNSSNENLELTLLSAWLDVSATGLCVVDDTSRIVMLNPAACEILGVDGLDMLNQPMRKLLGGLDIDGTSLLQWLCTPGFDGERHVTRTHPQGKTHILLKSRTHRALEGGMFKMIAMTDVSELLAAQASIDSAASRRRWEALHAGVVISDAQQPDMPITYVNSKFEEMSGYTAAEVLGRNCRFLQGPESDEAGIAAIRLAIKQKTNGYALLRNYRKDGSIFTNELFIAPLRDDAGEVTHYIGIQHLQTASAEIAPRPQ